MKDKIKGYLAYQKYGRHFKNHHFMIGYIIEKLGNRLFLWLGDGAFEYAEMVAFLHMLEKYEIQTPIVINGSDSELINNVKSLDINKMKKGSVLMGLASSVQKQAEDAAAECRKNIDVISLDELLVKRTDELEVLLMDLQNLERV